MNNVKILKIEENEECDEEVIEYFDAEESSCEYFSIESSPRISEDSTGENDDNPSKKVSNMTAQKPIFPCDDLSNNIDFADRIKSEPTYNKIEVAANSNSFGINELTFMERPKEQNNYDTNSSCQKSIKSVNEILPSNVIPIYDTDSREIDVNPNFKESPFSTKDNGGFITAGMHVDEYENLINKESKYVNI